ncbi:MAG: hypothetical protein IH940_13210 [Acidobacteria bacterium]|nr:hypothetical protein [Acidobacteriota bacterium]
MINLLTHIRKHLRRGQLTHGREHLDGPKLNERSVKWGSLQANFVRFDETETFSSWTYRTDYDSGTFSVDGPQPDQILLPGGAHPGDPLSVVAEALTTAAAFDDVFVVYYIDTDTRSVWADSEDGPINFVGVPFIPRCD